MPRRYLFGPVSPAFADQNLRRHVQAGDCLPFGQDGAAGLRIDPGDTWEEVLARLPAGWGPDFVVLDLHYTSVPPCLWAAPLPLVGLAADWNLLWHRYRHCLPRCDLVLTDTAGVEVLAREGVAHARAANLFGCERAFLEAEPATERDIDILFVGNVNSAEQRERLAWLGRLARLIGRWRVEVHTNVYGEEYRRLLSRARVAFNRSVRGECNLRAFEAAACGALLFQEAGNREVPAYFRDRRECVFYTDDNLEELLEHFLTHEDERRALAAAARERVTCFSFADLWEQHLGLVEREWPGMLGRAARRPAPGPEEALLARSWQAVSGGAADAPALVAALGATLAESPRSAELHNALGLATALTWPRPERSGAAAARAAEGRFRRAWECDPTHALAGLNLAEALAACGRKREAVEQARQLLRLLDWQLARNAAALRAGHFPPGFDHFRVEWERAAWQNAGRPEAERRAKADLLRWRLHALLAGLTGDLAHHHEAALARPDLPPTRAALGQALARSGRPGEAVPHLRQAVEASPFDRAAARALYDALGAAGDGEGQRRLVEERRLLARAAPALVPAEGWFAEPPAQAAPRPAGGPLAVAWEGPQEVLHSLAHVNRELCRRLIARGHEVSVLPSEADERPGPAVAVDPLVAGRFRRPLSRPADVCVRHRWPPDLSPPAEGRWVVVQPWEFGSLPRAWVGPLSREADEVWAYSRYVRDCYVQSGVPKDRVHVVPLGVAPERFWPEAPPLALRTRKRFKFLFVGGTIHRKGIDVLLGAYARAFTATDDVCLVIKEMGAGTFYRGQTAEGRIAELQSRPGAPEVEYLTRDLSEAELAGLYTACDCLAHPYRGEGFGLPVEEAMASGLPVIVTGHGAALDFCDEGNAFLVPARVAHFRHRRVGDLETVGRPWLAEPDAEALAYLLRYVLEHPDEARARAAAGRARVLGGFTWEHAADAAERRLRELCQRPVRRLGASGPPSAPAAAADKPVAAVAGPGPGQLTARVVEEEGAVPPRPTGGELASIIIPCCNQVECTRLCLDSVLRHTRPPYELILVDNGSTDATPALLEDVRSRPGPQRVEVVRNDSNRGFAAACSQRLAQARGRYLVLLHNDTVVTEGWLDLLVKCVLHQWPHVGMAGPVTNRTAPPQQIDVPYERPEDMPAFAAQRRREYRGRATEVARLTGFCLLARREVLEQVGALDERFGVGFYEDEDLSFRARDAGYKLLVAQDVFVHHFGGRTFAGLGLDPAAQLRHNFGLFRDKWGPARTENYRPAGCQPAPALPAAPARRQRVSLCMIVKDEADKLADCLGSVADLVDEMVVVDTGSADSTREVAARCGARVFNFSWVDDFSAARNESVRRATGEWVFWLDADERLDAANRRRLRAVLAGLKDERVAYVMRQLSEAGDGSGSAMAVDQVRLFRREPGVGWEYRVHEQVLLSLRRAGHDVRWTEVVIGHAGYRDERLADRKLERNLALLRRQDAERPGDPVTLYHLGLALGQQGRTEEALPHLRRSLELAPADYSIRPKLHAMLARGQHRLGRLSEALAACRAGLREHPEDVELLFTAGLLLREAGDLAGAEAALVRLLGLPARPGFASVDAGLRTHKARHLLGEVHRQQGRAGEAEAAWLEAVGEQPGFAPAWQGLGELWLSQGRWPDVERAAAGMEAASPREAALLRARRHLARREFAEARELLEEVIRRGGKEVGPRLLLSRVLLQEGKDPTAAEAALRVILELDPGNREASCNLAVLLREKGLAPVTPEN